MAARDARRPNLFRIAIGRKKPVPPAPHPSPQQLYLHHTQRTQRVSHTIANVVGDTNLSLARQKSALSDVRRTKIVSRRFPSDILTSQQSRVTDTLKTHENNQKRTPTMTQSYLQSFHLTTSNRDSHELCFTSPLLLYHRAFKLRVSTCMNTITWYVYK